MWWLKFHKTNLKKIFGDLKRIKKLVTTSKNNLKSLRNENSRKEKWIKKVWKYVLEQGLEKEKFTKVKRSEKI